MGYSDGTRATYDCEDINARQMTYKSEPSVVIRKTRLDDVNIKCAPQGGSLCSDLRISCSTEVEAKLPQGKGAAVIRSERIKERTSFRFNFMQLDMTVT